MRKVPSFKLLLSIGLLLLALSFIIEHYFQLADFSKGLLKGVAIGLLILSVVKYKSIRQAS